MYTYIPFHNSRHFIDSVTYSLTRSYHNFIHFAISEADFFLTFSVVRPASYEIDWIFFLHKIKMKKLYTHYAQCESFHLLNYLGKGRYLL